MCLGETEGRFRADMEMSGGECGQEVRSSGKRRSSNPKSCSFSSRPRFLLCSDIFNQRPFPFSLSFWIWDERSALTGREQSKSLERDALNMRKRLGIIFGIANDTLIEERKADWQLGKNHQQQQQQLQEQQQRRYWSADNELQPTWCFSSKIMIHAADWERLINVKAEWRRRSNVYTQNPQQQKLHNQNKKNNALN